MLSKAAYTDLLVKLDWDSLNDVTFFWAHDPFVFQFIKSKLKKSHDLKVVFANELSISWLEEKFVELSLFSNNESYFVHNAQLLSAELLDYISGKLAGELSERGLYLCFQGKATLKTKLKKHKVPMYEFEDVKFWEYEKVVLFLAAHFSIELPRESFSLILNYIENDLSSLYTFISQLSLFFTDKKPTLEDVKYLIKKDRVDHFALASSLSKKDYSFFYKELADLIERQSDEVIGTLSFLQGHLFKLLDPSYMEEKKKLSQYDKQIKSLSRNWTHGELLEKIKEISKLLVMAKEKNRSLLPRIQGKHYRLSFS